MANFCAYRLLPTGDITFATIDENGQVPSIPEGFFIEGNKFNVNGAYSADDKDMRWNIFMWNLLLSNRDILFCHKFGNGVAAYTILGEYQYYPYMQLEPKGSTQARLYGNPRYLTAGWVTQKCISLRENFPIPNLIADNYTGIFYIDGKAYQLEGDLGQVRVNLEEMPCALSFAKAIREGADGIIVYANVFTPFRKDDTQHKLILL